MILRIFRKKAVPIKKRRKSFWKNKKEQPRFIRSFYKKVT